MILRENNPKTAQKKNPAGAGLRSKDRQKKT
jgi:hypothetical protein